MAKNPPIKNTVTLSKAPLRYIWEAYWLRLVKKLRWITHPITVFVTLQIVWLAITIIWVIWFVGQQVAITNLAQKFGREYFDSGTALVILIVGCVLLGMLLVGTISLFIFGQKQTYLARQQRGFISSVTHELKSPLASLQLAVETTTRHKLEGEMAERINNMIMTDIERLKRLVDQILVASRIDRGAFLFSDETVPSNFDGMLKQIVRKLEHLDPEIGGRLVIKIPEGLLIKTASASLDLIISNLLENAIKYSPRKSPITVTVHEAKGKMILAIEDQGHGMDKRDLRRVFKMFYRSETATRKAIPGTGLGLYIVKSVAKVMGGRVWAESRGLSYGSTFFLSLPDGYFTINADQDFE